MFLIMFQTQYEFVFLITRAQSVVQAVVFHLISPNSILIKFSSQTKILSLFFITVSIIKRVISKTRSYLYTYRIPISDKLFEFIPSGGKPRSFSET